MAAGFRKRYVQTPDGERWIVERHWLARRPRYFGYRFRRPRGNASSNRRWPGGPRSIGPTRMLIQPPLPNPYRDNKELARRDPEVHGSSGAAAARVGRADDLVADGLVGSVGVDPREVSGGGSRGGSSGGGSRGGSSGGGSKKGGGGGAAGAAGGILAVLAKALLYVAIVAAVIAVALLTIFVLVPGLVFVAQYVLFWLLVGGWILYNTLTGRPWVIKATRDGYENPDHAYRIKGWRNSPGAHRRHCRRSAPGEPPIPSEVAVEVELIED